MSRYPPPGDTRYSKDQLLSIFQTLKDSSTLDRKLEDVFQGTWNPHDRTNGAGNLGLGGDGKDHTPGPEVCWNYNSHPQPFGLTGMTEEEKEVGARLFNVYILAQLMLVSAFLNFGQLSHQAATKYRKRRDCRGDRWAQSFTLKLWQHDRNFKTRNTS